MWWIKNELPFLVGFVLMVKCLSLFHVDRRHTSRQRKKDALWSVPDYIYYVPSLEELRIIRDRAYLEATFPNDSDDAEDIIGVDDL